MSIHELCARYADKRVLVTGGGAGIGRATAQRLAQEGAAVAVADLDLEAARETCAGIAGTSIALQADVTDPASVEVMVGTVVSELGGIDMLHANVGTPQRPQPFEQISVEEWRRVHDVNVTGALVTAQAVVPRMREAAGGSIVFTSSMAAVRVREGMAAYVSSKAGLNGLVRVLALELAPDRIRVNAVLPSAVLTDMLRAMSYGDDVEASIAAVSNSLPLGGPLDAEDIAAAVAYLGADEARYVTGVLLNVDAGRSL
jgi:3-oxoacyl-[acyl-carrier protein] reductase